ncbi:MAG: phosphatidylserine decarboxylase family protein [Bacteroidetes bacterium]|nr:phosphatidylserine decarboxylase family protein [Bacteroidota bacterium]
MITPYGRSTFLKSVLIALSVAILVHWFLSWVPGLTLLVDLLVIAFIGFALNFFRDPERKTDSDPSAIVSPADGTVVMIKKLDHDEFIGGPATLVAVFMSPLNVHVNRIPMNGTVTLLKYHPGLFLKAWEDRASEENERSEIGIENGKNKVLFKQIAGFVARRIVYPDIEVGKTVTKGTRFGMIKFGSRVDIIVPASWEIKVKPQDITRAGETVVALIPEGVK